MHILVTGAAGKVGAALIADILARPEFSHASVTALCHNRPVPESDRVSSVFGSIADRATVRSALRGTTHVVHLATCKETPEDVMDVTVKGLFWLLEECRSLPHFERFILVGGDAAVGHFFYPYGSPITESSPHRAYPGCYALSKVLEETMLTQFQIQYAFPGCTLRAPWIMEKDDFKFSLSFGHDVFGGPRWRDFFTPEEADQLHAAGTVPLALDEQNHPLKRNFVHVTDLVAAIRIALEHPNAHHQLFNIAMDEPVDYAAVAAHLATSQNFPSIEIQTPFHSTWLDISKAKLLLNWRPTYDLPTLIDSAFSYHRPTNDPRTIHYPG